MDERYETAAEEMRVLWSLFQAGPPGMGKAEGM
jgi:hypothetical protein